MALLRRFGDPQAATRAAMASHPMDSGAEPSRPFEDAVRRQSHDVARSLGKAESGHALDLITREAFVAYLALARAHGETYYISRYEQQLALVQAALRDWSGAHPASATSPALTGPNWGALVLVLGAALLAAIVWAGSSSSDVAAPATADVAATAPPTTSAADRAAAATQAAQAAAAVKKAAAAQAAEAAAAQESARVQTAIPQWRNLADQYALASGVGWSIVSDVSHDDYDTYGAACRSSLRELAALRADFRAAPGKALATAAREADASVTAVLSACGRRDGPATSSAYGRFRRASTLLQGAYENMLRTYGVSDSHYGSTIFTP